MHTLSVAQPQTRNVEGAFAALLLGLLMAQLDTNVVVAALPSIGAELGATDAVAGVTAVYLLTVTVATPVLGKLGDLIGRRNVFVASVLLFAAGSLACALAPTMAALIGARAFQGFGGGGLVVTAVSALGELFDRAELLRRQLWLTGTFAVSSLAGPPLGGLLAAGPGWAWIFMINLPVCALALVLGLRGLPAHRRDSAGVRFDVPGAVLVAFGGTCVVALGSSASLAASPIWAPILVAAALMCAALFRRAERRAASPLVPPELFSTPVLARSIMVTGLSGVALFGTFTFIPLAVAAGTGRGTGAVGVLLLALTAGQLVVTTTFALLARRHPRLTAWGGVGLAMGVVGLLLVAVVPQLRGLSTAFVIGVAIVGMALAGAALGLSMQAYTLLGQTTAPRDSFGAAMGTLTFARQLGGSLGAAAFGWLLLTVPGDAAALTAILAVAAAVMATALIVAPRGEPETEAIAGGDGFNLRWRRPRT